MKSNPLSLQRRNLLGSLIAVSILMLLYLLQSKEQRYSGNQSTVITALFIIVFIFHTWVIPAWKSPQARAVAKSIFSYSCFTGLITGIANLFFLLFIDPSFPDSVQKKQEALWSARGYTAEAIAAQYENSAAFHNPVLASVITMSTIFIITLTLTSLSSLIIHGVKRRPPQLAS